MNAITDRIALFHGVLKQSLVLSNNLFQSIKFLWRPIN